MKKIILLLTAFIFTATVFAQSDSLHYKIALMFGSKGDGTPDAKPVTDFVATFKKKNKIKKISYDRIGPVGREGEYYMAYTLKELTRRQRAAFIAQFKRIAEMPLPKGYINPEENFAYSKADAAGKISHIKL